jgi:SAM-dependent methyltransferase
VASQAERATSFGAIAAEYDRLRPSPAPEAVRWLLPERHDVTIDVAAGTGLLSRVLAAQVRSVVAVELDHRMAAVLRQRSPGVQVVQGRGEALPLAGASADAVLISSAWHWLDLPRAVPEIARVLRPGGRLCVLRTSVDPATPWLRELRSASEGEAREGGAREGEAREGGAREGDARPPRQRGLPETGLFGEVVTGSFEFTRAMSVDDFTDMLATYSAVITASAGERSARLARVRAGLGRLFPGASHIDVPMRTGCCRADRLVAD